MVITPVAVVYLADAVVAGIGDEQVAGRVQRLPASGAEGGSGGLSTVADALAGHGGDDRSGTSARRWGCCWAKSPPSPL